MKILSTFLVCAILGLSTAKAQSDLLYVSGENDATPGNAPTLYIQGSADVYVEGGVVAENANTRTSHDGLLQVNGTLHVANYSGVGAGNWTNSTGSDLYTYNNTSVPATSTYAPGVPGSITYGANAQVVSLEYGTQLISGSKPSHFYNLSLLDSTIDRPAVQSYKTVSGSDVYVGTSGGYGTLDLNDEYLLTQNNTVHLENPSTSTSGTQTAVSRLYASSPTVAVVDNTAPYQQPAYGAHAVTGGMVIASNVGATEYNGRLSRVTNTSGVYAFPVGSLVSVPSPNTGQAYDLFRPAEIIPPSSTAKEFGVALVPRDGFSDAGSTMDQAGTAWHSLSGINHQSYYKINQLAGTLTDSEQIRLYHAFYSNSTANATTVGQPNYPNWSTCGNLPDQDFPQTLTVAQYDQDGVNVSWNDVCHGASTFTDYAGSCGSVTVSPNGDFCNNSVINAPPALNSTTTIAYQVPGKYYGTGNNPQEDYSVAGLFFSVDGGSGSCDGNCSALPLNIVSLTGWNVGDENQLQWVTATEENTDYFIVEKSIDGVNFTPLDNPGDIHAQGYSSSPVTYTYYDKQPNIGNNYYRIREVMLNSQYLLTNIINVPLNKKITIASIYPNPTSGKLNVAFETSTTGSVQVEVYDVLGRLVIKTDNAVSEGNNIISVNTIPLAAGSYFIRLTDTNSNYTDTQKFIKVTE